MSELPSPPPAGSGHPDDEALAAHGFDPSADPTVSGHLASCAVCTARTAEFGQVGDDLRTLIPPMPPGLADRLAAALAHEQRSGSVPDTPPAPESDGASVTDLTAAGRHRRPDAGAPEHRATRLPRVIGGIAAGLIVLGGGGWLAADLVGGAGSIDSATSAEAAGGAVTADEGPSVDRRDFDRASLTAAVPSLVGERPAAPEATAGSGPESGGPDTGTDTGATGGRSFPACLDQVPVAAAEALSITAARYDGVDALILIFADGPGAVQVTVLSDCATGVTSQVLDEFTAAR